MDAWLVKQAVAAGVGEEHEQVALALALDASDADPRRAADVLAALKRASLRSLGIHDAILVNESIRSATEQHGIKVYSARSRAAPRGVEPSGSWGAHNPEVAVQIPPRY
jgi:hypothetical protein